jgi:hypothetical protein
MRFRPYRWIQMLSLLLLTACQAASRPAALPATAQPAAAASTPIPTAPPPILYPPHDPEATYPVIRTWTEVLEFEPFPYLKPLPPEEATALDAVYAKTDPSRPQWWRCARCADFMLAGGNWRLMLHQGTMRMYYEVTGFSTVASYSIDGNRLDLFNDPHCPYEIGQYTWSLENRSLRFSEVQDSCAIHLRAENLTHQPWISCQPPNSEAAVTDHWIRPSGCG